ncbi:MAG TPA: HIT family protein [Candidatus Nanoarchaeia archaeon]|nr:HIT family protein [Candidatus Nanoarchaeia archaeon]
MEDCIFCKIGSGKIPAHKVYQDKDFLAFLDIHPHALGHTVIIPKIHAGTIYELEDKESKGLVNFIKKVMKLIEEKIHPDGFNIGWNHNSAGGQVVPHLHLHIFPRFNGDKGGSMHSIIKNPRNKTVEEVAKLFR